jgi:glycosyltransferase involved in cell wall biosynthesis
VIGYLGRQSAEKNPLAPAKAVQAGPNHYHAIYYGFGRTGREFDRATVAWCDSHIAGRYRMFAPNSSVGNILAGFDVVMLASYREAFSLTLIEAWMAGVPVVATPVGSIPELEAKYGKLVFSVPMDPTPYDLASAVKRATTPVLRDPVVRRAKELVYREFTIRAMAARWAKYLEGVVRECDENSASGSAVRKSGVARQ